MSTLTSSTSNNNNNNLIINASSPLTTTSSSLNNNNNNNNSSNTINNNNNNISPNTPVSNTATLHHHHPHQSALASGVSSAKRLLPFARSMSSSNGGNTAAGSGAASAGGAAVGSSSIAAGLIPAELNVVLHGYHRKLKTNKKKYFVVYDDTPDKKARLEYFDSEKKFKQSWLKNSSVQAKRSIVLRSCFNINKRHDTKKHVIALYTKDDCFCIVFDSEDELNRWLRTLLSLQRGEESEGEPPRPTFEHVWDVFVQRKGLGDSYGILGNYRLCITDKTLSLVRIGPAVTSTGDDRVEIVEFSLASIRRCGASQRYFYLEVGRSSKTGAGEIWMEAQDAIIAHNMHTTIMKSAKSKDGDSLGPIQRNRSSSANAASKPTQMLVRRQTHTGQKPINCSPSGEDKSSLHASHAQSSESSSSATSTKTVVMVPQNPNSSQNLKANQNQQVNLDKLCTPVTSSPASTSHHPVAGRSQTMGGSPGGPILPPSHHCPSYPSPTPSYCKSSIKKPKLDPPQEEEGSASSPSSYASIRQPIAAGVASTQPVKLAQPTGVPVGVGVAGTLPSASTASVCTSASGSTTITTTEFPSPTDHGAAIARERCDSLPSRNRTTSETSGHQQQLIMNSGGMPPPRTIPSGSFTRPQSMVVSRQSHSHSPPVYSSPLSPPSTGIYTGSDGSSLSIDETDSFVGSLTPDEGNGFSKVINTLNSGCSIPEENSEEYIHNYGRINQRPFTQHRTIDEFSGHMRHSYNPHSFPYGSIENQNVLKSKQLRHSYNSLSLPISQAIRRGSPAPPTHVAGSAEGSGNYMEMCSPCGSSPGDPSGNGGYIPMSPITDFPRGLYTASSSAHSRASSLAEDTVDGYVPMAAPSHTEEYVDMEPSNTSNNRTTGPTAVPSGGAGGPGGGANSNISSAASSCSIISGTPSTDMRFSEYHLEKVVARFTPSEDDEMDRPLRTYSVGSRLEHNKRKLRVDMLSSEGASNSRVRAFSVGSRAKVPRSDLYKGSGGAPITAPLLSAGSSGSIQESTSNSGSITNTAIGVNVASSTASACSGSSCKVGKKSSSAPVLPIKSHGSFDPMDDLMEIDFGTQFQGEQEVSSSTPQKSLGMNDYMEMTASGGCGGDGDSRNSGYVEMKPGHITYSTNTSLHEESDYLDMRPGTRLETNLSTKSTSSPIQITSPKKFNNGSNSGGNSNNSYPQLSPRSITGGTMASSSSSQLHKTKVCSEDYLNVSPLMVASAGGDSGNEDKMMHEEDEIVAPSSAPEGYMEMSWKQTKSSHKPEGSMQASDEYINMDFSRKEGSRISAGIEPRQSSQPIAIQTGGNNRALSGDLMDPKMGGALSNIPNYLPLNPAVQQRHPAAAQIGYNLEQNTVRTRCDSRDSGIVTPSGSQATIFPFSPGSPIKSFPMTTESSSEERKCYVDGTTGTLRISEMDEENSEESSEFQDMNQEQHSKDPENTKLEDLSHNYAELSLGQQQQQQQQQQKAENSHPSCFDNTKRANLSLILTPSTNTRTTPTVTAMKSIIEYPDYVNCSPATTPVAQKPSTPTAVVAASAVFDQAGDYAIMNPASLRKLSSTSQSELPTSDAGLPPLTRKSNLIGFKPITSSQDEALLKKSSAASPKPTFSRQYSERRTGMSSSDTSGYEILQRTSHSRPNSVNSEKIGGKCLPSVSSTTRPNSANSDRLPIISATSSSASSASTLCESKNQSPTASSTMIAMAAGAANRLESAASLTNPSVISRPPSVSSERELHYASLDLPPCGTASTAATGTTSSNRMDIDSDSSAPPSASATSRIGEPDSLNSTPSPNSGCTSQQQTGSAFTYAQIDFVRLVAQSGGNQAPKQTPTKSDQQP
ncbi:mucin-12 isoform X4 [Toxorhynchites rutilus septentrionalis]|uniref:mucin-12 isoform X4 n=1 Tax=Toxorhynchites rutilus septentrionalis TaxID=329112 RepID=UPI0024799221|nr:mucin-12 isoform X4 [Toxorhynchites rutilus septentrionalis]